MGFYTRHIFPRIVNWVMAREPFGRLRRETLAEAAGDTLEIGFGTGLNLPHYPAGVKRLTAVDVNPGMLRIARRRMAASRIPIDRHTLDGESLPFPSGRFDSAVSTWTLCSIPRPERALAELYRTLKPGGRLCFIEHGLARDPEVRTWQHRLTPWQKRLADGCHLDRNLEQLLRSAGFSLLRLETFYMEKAPRVAGYLYRGVAEKPAPDAEKPGFPAS